MAENFYKYESLGNDFILIDYFYKDADFLKEKLNGPIWKNFVIDSCNRHFGIGADGVLVLKKDISGNYPELLIFNSDGSQAETCLNGLRCAALHLREYHDINKIFTFKMGKKLINCTINKNIITTKISGLVYSGSKQITLNNKSEFHGHVVNVGNPHFIITKKVTPDWVEKYGKFIESHELFLNKTNVEFVWLNFDLNKNTKSISNYNVLVYERGVGPTLSCGSGASAICWFLYKTRKIVTSQKITLNFLGGYIICWIDKNEFVNLQAKARLVFKGQI
ncbi:diaminopimelate epimerase [Candidatus Dependentiae bacterium]|nr:diaminopimelate epimerase [Candidatus Dependentiae bacterium]MBU4387357.1 diaminopimelate epimerase [Candidatus Dependentiae bacterium]MCG2756074.1 diaminopimelate epimerase [Candidatus Dependentiae bacterium]